MPAITGRIGLILTIRDPVASAAWYGAVLGLEVIGEHARADGRIEQVCLQDGGSGLTLCLVDHEQSAGDPFCEFRTGLDHIEFFVAACGELDAWVNHLDDLGIAHSGIKAPPYTANRMITFRDPDNIQLELFWEAPTS